jgi:hypothetical protein
MDETSSRSIASSKWTPSRIAFAFALAACLLFFLVGNAFIPLLGIENDEAIFANSLFDPAAAYYKLGPIPLMVTSYAGTLKTWIYAPLFRIFGTGVWQLREPMLIAAAASLWMFFLLLRRVAGDVAAAIGVCLLAVDSGYLLTSVFDWGPVALQHLLLIGAVLLAVRFAQTRGILALAGAFFLKGLAMWEKALAVWLLSGLSVAAAAVYGRRLVELFSWRRAAVAVAAFALGALPLILFNAHSGLETFRKNTVRDTVPLSAKAHFLLQASHGGALFENFIPPDSLVPSPHPPSSWGERIAARVSRMSGHPQNNGLPIVFFAALLLAPLAGWPAARAIIFCLITMVVAWFEMAMNANTGGSVHHTILLWPLPQAIAAISFAGVLQKHRGRTLRFAAALLLIPTVAGALVINEYYARIVRDGGTTGWTPALFTLSDYLMAHPAPRIFCVDWGMLNTLLLLSDGRLHLYLGSDPVFNREPGPDDLRVIRWMTGEPGAIFVAHTPGNEFFQGANARLVHAADSMGYRKKLRATVPDGFGHDQFEIYRFVGPDSR